MLASGKTLCEGENIRYRVKRLGLCKSSLIKTLRFRGFYVFTTGGEVHLW